MTTGVAQNVTISSSAAAILTIDGLGIPGTGILIDNTSAFTLTITARVGIDTSQAWTNNSGNLFTVSGATLVSVRIIPYGERHRKHAYLRRNQRRYGFRPY